MQGAPSHTDTFDLKPNNGMPVARFNPTEYYGVLFPQGLMPGIAEQFDSVTLLRFGAGLGGRPWPDADLGAVRS